MTRLMLCAAIYFVGLVVGGLIAEPGMQWGTDIIGGLVAGILAGFASRDV